MLWFNAMAAWKDLYVLVVQIAAIAAMFSMVGCSTPPVVPSTPSATAEAGHGTAPAGMGRTEARRVPADQPESLPDQIEREKRTTELVPPPEAASEEGEFVLQIESLPSNALIIIDGAPSGRTPMKILLAVTPQGFARARTSIKVRFLAMLPGEQSVTIEDQLTPLDRIPVGLIFTPSGVQRRW